MKKHSTEAIPLILGFCHWLKEKGKSPSTILTYKRELQKYQEWLQEKNSGLHRLTKNNIQSYIAFLEQKQKSPATIDKTIGAIRTFTKFLKKPELVFGIEIHPIKNEEFESLSSNQYEELLSKVKDNGSLRDIAIVYVFLQTGVRVSELCQLNTSHIDLVGNTLKVEKNEDGRVIPLSHEVKLHLENYLQTTQPKDALFVTSSGDRITERAVQYMLKKYGVNPNKLRHTFCQRLVDAKVDLEIVSELAGIKDINLTKRYLKNKNKHRLEEVINNTFISNKTLG